jgi:tetratricopeptide (TPR) repeat protein
MGQGSAWAQGAEDTLQNMTTPNIVLPSQTDTPGLNLDKPVLTSPNTTPSQGGATPNANYNTPLTPITGFPTTDPIFGNIQAAQKAMADGEYPQAIGLFQAALRQNPDAGRAASLYHNLGLAYAKSGQTQLSIAAFQHALRLRPQYDQTYASLAKTYTEAGLAPTAMAMLQKAVAQNTLDARAYYLLGWVGFASGQPTVAKSAWQRYITLTPNDGLAAIAKKRLAKI